MEVAYKSSLSIQAQLIRDMQAKEGKEPCYATPMAAHCDQRSREKCSWRHDCFDDAEEADEISESWSEAAAEKSDKSWLDG